MRRIIALTACAGALLAGSGVRAQSANPLTAPLPPPRIGAEAGLNINNQSGSFESDCHCSFPTGSGNAIFVGAVGEMHIDRKVALMARATLSNISTVSTTSIDTLQMLFDKKTGVMDTLVIPLNEKSTATLAYLVITPMIRYDVLKNLYIALGPSIGLALSGKLHTEETVATGGYTFLDGGTVQVHDQSIPDLSAIRLSLSAHIGYEFEITPKLLFVPTAGMDFPLTNVASNTTWKISSFQVAGSVRWKLHL